MFPDQHVQDIAGGWFIVDDQDADHNAEVKGLSFGCAIP
jgi:hypothetical protein